MYKFDGKRYLTKDVNEQIPLQLQIAMWSKIEELRSTDIEMDYLQVFKLEKVNNVMSLLKVTHTQEQPLYKKEYVVENIDIAENLTVFVIDDVDHVTMLLASEY